MAPALKSVLFSTLDAEHSIYSLAVASDAIEETIYQDAAIISEKENELVPTFNAWKDDVRSILLDLTSGTNPKALIRDISGRILATYHDSRLLDRYDVYDCLLNYWNENSKMMSTLSRRAATRSVVKSNMNMPRRRQRTKMARPFPWMTKPR